MNRAQNLFLKRFLIILFAFCIIISYPTGVSAKIITGTQNEHHADYRKSLENKYGYKINISDDALKKGGFYKSPRDIGDLELRILQDIESTFAMLPDGLVKEVNTYMQKFGGVPTLNIVYLPNIGGTAELGYFEYEYEYHGDGTIIINQADIALLQDGNRFTEILLHEFAHKLTLAFELNGKLDIIEKYFTDISKKSFFFYNENYGRLYRLSLDSRYYDYYLSEYSSVDFWEDFAETFAHAVMQPRYISSYGKGVKKPVHQKIEMMSKMLTDMYASLKDAEFLLNCLPTTASKWAENSVKTAKTLGIVPWDIHGLNTFYITRYDAVLILQPFLYKYIDEEQLFNTAGIKKNEVIPQNFVYDIIDSEDIFLINKLGLMMITDGRFNPNGKIQRQSAAIMFTKVAQLFGLSNSSKKDVNFADSEKIAHWALAYVKFAAALNIMGADDNNNFNPEKYITYQEFYNSLVNICALKELYNIEYKITTPISEYFQIFEQGTTLDANGWIHYYKSPTLDKFTGKARCYIENGDIYEGELINGTRNGEGKYFWKNGATFEGEFLKNEIWTGIYITDGVLFQLKEGKFTE